MKRSFLPPEVLEVVKNERFICKASSDSWQFGMVLYVCLIGSTPWKSADWVRDAKYAAFMKYQKRETTKIPDNFRRFSPRLLRAFRRFFDHIEEDRAKVSDINKYMKNRWVDTKITTSKSTSNIATNLQPQAYSDQDSVKYINHRESRNSFDGRLRARRMTSVGGLTPEPTPVFTGVDPETARNKVWDWLESNDLNRHDSQDDVVDFSFWSKSESKTYQYAKRESIIGATSTTTASLAVTREASNASSVQRGAEATSWEGVNDRVWSATEPVVVVAAPSEVNVEKYDGSIKSRNCTRGETRTDYIKPPIEECIKTKRKQLEETEITNSL
ncbi:hypothetical protein pipiens_014756 [Culex pipiens pipiens]|uniref:Protein kinase domain-containing protein n=1 Tax=Culex pipiens pipiens TaxID=38569 RepID=A0ABD1CT83_CULPP